MGLSLECLPEKLVSVMSSGWQLPSLVLFSQRDSPTLLHSRDLVVGAFIPSDARLSPQLFCLLVASHAHINKQPTTTTTIRNQHRDHEVPSVRHLQELFRRPNLVRPHHPVERQDCARPPYRAMPQIGVLQLTTHWPLQGIFALLANHYPQV